jgi:DNA topoisomerase VI subunit B
MKTAEQPEPHPTSITEDELFKLIAYGDVNDPATVKRIATAKISRATMQRVERRVRDEIHLDIERADLDQH